MIVLPKDHAEWLKERKFGIGASDSAAIMGVSKWKNNLQLWEEKTGQREPEDISWKPHVQYGHDAEPHIRALFALDHPELEITYDSPYKIIRSDVHPFMFCTPDGEITEKLTGRNGGLEIKTTKIENPRQWSEWDGQIPDTYYCQVCHQMLSTGWEFVWLVVQIKWITKEGELRKMIKEYCIEREEVAEDLEYIEAETIEFWESIENKKQPALKLPEI